MRKIFLLTGLALLATSFTVAYFGNGHVSDLSLKSLTDAIEPDIVSFNEKNSGYLIIAPEETLSLPALGEFVAHKSSLDFQVETVSIEYVRSLFDHPDPADSIREFLKQNCKRLELGYLLLIGDPDPVDVKIKLPVEESLPGYIVSAPTRSLGGTYASERPEGKISSQGASRLLLLEGPGLQVLSPGYMKYWYVNCTSTGKLRFFVYRYQNGAYKKIFDSGIRDVKKPGVAYTSTDPVKLEKGDYLGLLLPAEESATVGTVKTPGTVTTLVADPAPSQMEILSDNLFTNSVEELPLLQCSVYFEPEDRIGSVPSKMCWPMGTYNGVYSSLARNSCLMQCSTDAYFANLNSKWDSNGNGFFGETFQKYFRYDGKAEPGEIARGDFQQPGRAFLPEIYVGRIPFDEHEAVSKILRKTIAYEKSGDINWRKSALLGADPLAPDTDNYGLCEKIISDITTPAGFVSKRFYTEHDFEGEVQSPSNYGYKPEILVGLEEIKKDWSAGYDKFSRTWAEFKPGMVIWSSHANTDICRNIITLRDHGSSRLPLPVTRKFVSRLDDDHPAIVFAVACSVTQQEPYYLGIRKKRTRLEHNWEPRPNIGRELLKNGAVSFVGPTRSTWFRHGWNSPEDGGCLTLAYDFANNILKGTDIGGALAGTLSDYNVRWGSELDDGENLLTYNIYGDPSLVLGTNEKSTPSVMRPAELPGIETNKFTENGDSIEFRTASEKKLELQIGSIVEIESIIADADGSSLWFEREGFVISSDKKPDKNNSYYSGTARHTDSMLTLSMPLAPGQELKAAFNCWFDTEPGIDYTLFEHSQDKSLWSPVSAFSGVSSNNPLFGGESSWRHRTISFSTGENPIFIRFRYSTNDEYKQKPHEGFYVDDFKLSSVNGEKVKYISGWQNLRRENEAGTFSLRNPGAGDYYIKATAEFEKFLSSKCHIYRLVISEKRNKSFNELIKSPIGVFSSVLGLLGILLLLFGILTVSAKNGPGQSC